MAPSTAKLLSEALELPRADRDIRVLSDVITRYMAIAGYFRQGGSSGRSRAIEARMTA